MANSNVPMFIQTIITPAVQIANADGTTKKTLYTAGSQGSVIEALGVTNTDTNPYTVNLYINDGSTDHLIATINVPASSGNTTSAPTVDVLKTSQTPHLEMDAVGNQVLKLKASYILKVASTSTVTSGKILDFVGHGGDF